MKVKLSDISQSQIEVSSVSQIFNADNDSNLILINIREPSQNFDYYKNIFTDEAIKTVVVIDNKGSILATLHGQEIMQISSNLQESDSFVSINITM